MFTLTFAASGSEDTKLTNLVMHATPSNIPSSKLISKIWAPFSTWALATANAAYQKIRLSTCLLCSESEYKPESHFVVIFLYESAKVSGPSHIASFSDVDEISKLPYFHSFQARKDQFISKSDVRKFTRFYSFHSIMNCPTKSPSSHCSHTSLLLNNLQQKINAQLTWYGLASCHNNLPPHW